MNANTMSIEELEAYLLAELENGTSTPRCFERRVIILAQRLGISKAEMQDRLFNAAQ